MMMVQRSLLRPDQLDTNGSYEMAQLVIDGYSGGFLQDGYLMGLVLTDGYTSGSETIRMDAHDGAINQIGSGQVTFNGNVQANQHVTIEGDLTVKGTTTSIETEQMIVSDPITAINASGSEALSDWSGLSARDQDGYNRFGWVFDDTSTGTDDGYWALTPNGAYNADPDAVPTRALAYLGEGDSYGDLSSTEDGNSGADKIAITPIYGIPGTNVQEALEDLASGDVNITGTASPTFTFNTDAEPSTDEDICLIMKGGDGTSLMEGYLCMITDSVAGTILQYTQFDDGVHDDRNFHLGALNDTSDVDACLYLNAGNGTDAYSASVCLGGDEGILQFTSNDTQFNGDVDFNDDVSIDGRFDAYGVTNLDGPVTLGGDPSDCITFVGRICSDIIPMVDDAYDIGSDTNKFQDGYFTNLFADEFTIENNFIVNGDMTIGDDSSDCLTINASLCSDLIPSIDDAYSLGDPTHQFKDGYFDSLHVDELIVDENITNDGDTTLGSDSSDCLTVNASLCSDLIPSTDDTYSLGSETYKFQDGYFSTLHADDVDISNQLTVDGYVTLGDTSDDHLIFNGTIYSDLNPEDCSHQLGDEDNRWIDAYLCAPTFDNITPVGNDDSLIGILKGIDDALANVSIHPERGGYVITDAEASADELDSARSADQGQTVDVSSLTDADFRDLIYIYLNGQLLYNDPSPAADTDSVVNDVARKTGTLNELVFSGNIRKDAVIQIVDMR